MAGNDLTYEQLVTAFRHKNFRPLYFLYGEERFLADELQELLRANALAPHERDFNLDIVYGHESNAKNVLSLCSAYPVMAERRVVIVRDFENLEDNQLFKTYAENPNPTAVVLLACGSRPNLATNPYRALKQQAAAFECKPLYPKQMHGWLKNRAEMNGYRMDPEALRMLADYVGTNLRVAAGELEKLATFAAGRQTITADDVVHASGQTREFNVFELQRAIGSGRDGDAYRIAERMLQQASNARGEALMIVAVLTSFFTKLWKLTACAGQSEMSMAERIGVPRYFIKEYLQSVRKFPLPSIEASLTALLAADYELKGGAERGEHVVMTLALRKIVASRSLS